MNRTHSQLFIAFCLLLLAAAGCGSILGPNTGPSTFPPTVTPITFPTVAAATETSASVPAATIPVATVPATAAPASVTPVAPSTPTPLVVVVAATPGPTQTTQTAPTRHGDGPCNYIATFLTDVTIPDNTLIPAGTPFVKTWRIRNDGTCSWGTSGFALHQLVYTGGTQLSSLYSVSLPAEVRPGTVVDISVSMVAPGTPGTYRTNWMLQVDNGPQVGVGTSGTVPLYAQIVVTPALPPPGGATRVTFEPGATDAVVSGSLQAGQNQDYVLTALQGQTMILTLSASGQASVTATGAQGIDPQVTSAGPAGTVLLAQLPATEDYVVRVSAASAQVNFSLNITIPQRISFAPGSTAAVLGGTTSARRTVTYLLRANGGQTANIFLTALPNTVGLTIYGLQDGQPLVRAVSGATSWNGRLPLTQDYVIQVVPAVDGAISFTLQASVI